MSRLKRSDNRALMIGGRGRNWGSRRRNETVHLRFIVSGIGLTSKKKNERRDWAICSFFFFFFLFLWPTITASCTIQNVVSQLYIIWNEFCTFYFNFRFKDFACQKEEKAKRTMTLAEEICANWLCNVLNLLFLFIRSIRFLPTPRRTRVIMNRTDMEDDKIPIYL